jgi:hypothetical protein
MPACSMPQEEMRRSPAFILGHYPAVFFLLIFFRRNLIFKLD